jgi:hypothetical protein
MEITYEWILVKVFEELSLLVCVEEELVPADNMYIIYIVEVTFSLV